MSKLLHNLRHVVRRIESSKVGGLLRSVLETSDYSRFAMGDSLYNLLSRVDFKLVDVGARGGCMPQLVLLSPFAHYYAFEPESEEAQTLPIKLRESATWRNITVIPVAISQSEEQKTLYITKQPGLSSFLQPNDLVVNRYYRNDEFQIKSTSSVNTISLDHAAENYGFNDACFLKLDTQGTELDILQSGRRLLQESLLGVYVEVEFHPFYIGQPLFSDVDAYLRSLGFALFDLHRALLRRASYRDDLYSRRQVVWAHALYLKEPSTIFHVDDDTTFLRASRLLGIAMAFKHYDLALELSTSDRIARLFVKAVGKKVCEEVEEFIRRRTKAILRINRASRSMPNLTAFSYKDKDNIYE